MAAAVGGPGDAVDRLAHASDGTGWWLGGVAGAGNDPRLLVAATSSTRPARVPLRRLAASRRSPAAESASSRAARDARSPRRTRARARGSAGRIAYIQAADGSRRRPPVANGRRSGARRRRDRRDGRQSCDPPAGHPARGRALAARARRCSTNARGNATLSWYDPATGHGGLGGPRRPVSTAPELAASDRHVVFRFGRTLARNVRTLSDAAIRPRTARPDEPPATPLDFSLDGLAARAGRRTSAAPCGPASAALGGAAS